MLNLFDYLIPLIFFKIGGLTGLIGGGFLFYKFYQGFGISFYKDQDWNRSRNWYLVKPGKANDSNRIMLLFLILLLLIGGLLLLSIKP